MRIERREIVIATIAAVLVCLALAAGFVLRGFIKTNIGAPLNTATVIHRVQSLSQLETVKYVMQKLVVIEDPKYFKGIIPLGESKLTLLAHGEVRAGVDMSQIKEKDITITETGKGKKIILRLPQAIVFDAHLDEHRTQVLERKTGLLIPFNKNMEQDARRFALTEITLAARQDGIENEAAIRARKQMAQFLQMLGFSEVEVR